MSSIFSNNSVTIPHVLLQRELGHELSTATGGYTRLSSRAQVESWSEADLLRHCSAEYASFLPAPRSTIALCYNCNGTLLASTHGDHTVKITSCKSGKISRVLNGHSRTPWVVRFHPGHPTLLASGSLDHEVRLWDASTGQCISRYTFGKPIASLAFHASVNVLAVACGHKLYMWEYAKAGSSPVIVLKTRRSMRAVHFHPHGEPMALTAEVQDPSPTPELPATLTEDNPSYVACSNDSIHSNMAINDTTTCMLREDTNSNDKMDGDTDFTGDTTARPSASGWNTTTNNSIFNTSPGLQSVLLSSRHQEVPRSIVDVGQEVPFPLNSFELQASLTTGILNTNTAIDGSTSEDAIRNDHDAQNSNTATQNQQSIPPLINVHLASLASVWNILGDQADQPPRVKIRLWKFDETKPSSEFDAVSGVLWSISDAVLCSEMGVHFSPCGRCIAATVACRAPMPPIPAHHGIIPPGLNNTTPAEMAVELEHTDSAAPVNAPMEWTPASDELNLAPSSLQSERGTANIDAAQLTPAPAHDAAPARKALPERVVFEVRVLSILNRKNATVAVQSTASAAQHDAVPSIQTNTLCAKRIRAAQCLTSVQFSPTGDHILLAYGKKHNSLLRSLIVERGSLVPLHTILELVRVYDMKVVGALPSSEDEINAACFHPMPGNAIAYGTKEGRLRTLSRNCSCGDDMDTV